MGYMIIGDVSTFLDFELTAPVVEAGVRDVQDQRWC